MIDRGPTAESEDEEELAVEWRISKGWWARARERTRGNTTLAVGGVLLLAYGVIAIAAIARFGADLGALPINVAWANSIAPPGPSRGHPFGVMNGIGIDVFSAVVEATPIDLALIGGPILLSVLLGLVLGAYAGLVGGPVDVALTFVTDLLATIPPFFFVVVLFLGVQPFVHAGLFLPLFGILFAVVLWPYHARPVRARALQIAGEPYVEAARAAGSGTGHILRRHVIPNSMYPLLAQIPVDVYNFLFVLTVFPFLGCFSPTIFQYLTPLPTTVYPEWGYLLAAGVCYGWSPLNEVNHWWMYAFPAVVVIVFGIAVALVCDGTERLLAGSRPTR